MPMLEVSDLVLGYGELEVVHGISFRVDEGSMVALVGSNGAGKTTTLGGIAGLIKPSSGTVRIEGTDVTGIGAHKLVKYGLRLVPEGRRIFGPLSVADNLRLGGYELRRSPRQIAARTDEVFDRFPRLRERRGQMAGTLSGGEQQMLALGRALMTRPRLLALDEPSLGLSPLMSTQILATARELADDGTAVLLVEQNVREALRLADEAYVLELGRVTLSGPAPEIAADKAVIAAYLGGDKELSGSDGAENVNGHA